MFNDNQKPARRAALWITIVQAGLLGVALGLGGYVLLEVLLQAPARAQAPSQNGAAPAEPPRGPGGRGFGGGVGGPERKLVAPFDKNGDKRLDAAERKAARESLAADPAARPFGGGFGRRGGPPGGRGMTP